MYKHWGFLPQHNNITCLQNAGKKNLFIVCARFWQLRKSIRTRATNINGLWAFYYAFKVHTACISILNISLYYRDNIYICMQFAICIYHGFATIYKHHKAIQWTKHMHVLICALLYNMTLWFSDNILPRAPQYRSLLFVHFHLIYTYR